MSFTNDNINRFVFVPSTDVNSIGVGVGALSTITTGTNNIAISTGLATGAPGTTTSNTFDLRAGATPIMTATNTNTTPVVSFPGSVIGLTVTVNNTTTLTATSTTTLVAIPGLSVPLVASGTYAFLASIPITSGSSGGAAVSLDTSNSLTVTSLALNGSFEAAASVANVNTTSFQSGIGSTATVLLVDLAGVVVANAAGNLIIKGAQNASNGTTTTFLANGFLQVTRIS